MNIKNLSFEPKMPALVASYLDIKTVHYLDYREDKLFHIESNGRRGGRLQLMTK